MIVPPFYYFFNPRVCRVEMDEEQPGGKERVEKVE